MFPIFLNKSWLNLPMKTVRETMPKNTGSSNNKGKGPRQLMLKSKELSPVSTEDSKLLTNNSNNSTTGRDSNSISLSADTSSLRSQEDTKDPLTTTGKERPLPRRTVLKEK